MAFTLLLIGLTAYVGATSTPAPQPTKLIYSALLSDVANGQVKSVEINQSSGKIDGTFLDGKKFTAQGPPGGLPESDLTLLDSHHVQRSYATSSSSGSLWSSILMWVFPLGLIALFFVWMSRRAQKSLGGLSGWSRSKAKVHVTDRPSTTFDDVAGYEAVKQELGEIVRFLKEPNQFRAIGARIPKGVLLVGPPGTGKTLFARAIAGEAGVPFITITGSEFMEMFVGVGAARVRDLFETARQNKPAIIFVDEIDAIGRKRGAGLGGGHDEREQTLNQLLSEMDGFEGQEGIILLAATNRPDILDPALMRAGRFDRQVVIPLPTLDERTAILGVHCRGKQMGSDVRLDALARGTPGMSGADLENLVNEAALIAVRRGSDRIETVDLDSARERVLVGLRRTSVVLSREEKRIVAYHEAGHALLAHLLPHADPLHKVSILPTGMALGATQQLPVEERQIEQLPYLQDALAVRLGGRAAEEVVFGIPSTGAQDDLVSATELASRMVREWGMSKRIGNMAWGPMGPVFLGEDLVHSRDYSDETARVIDIEIERILSEQAQRAKNVLAMHRPALDAIASALIEQESLDRPDIERILTEVEPLSLVEGHEGHTEEESDVAMVEQSQAAGTAVRTLPGDGSSPRRTLQPVPTGDVRGRRDHQTMGKAPHEARHPGP
ncbi:MAG TPA: ATP-dependent zinc metalloprotease FtsH [Acidimicrobiales bacterium]|nr:ATP-dependent zinc metalloprotease FtsH [Acidimicrobiales bacterium]